MLKTGTRAWRLKLLRIIKRLRNAQVINWKSNLRNINSYVCLHCNLIVSSVTLSYERDNVYPVDEANLQIQQYLSMVNCNSMRIRWMLKISEKNGVVSNLFFEQKKCLPIATWRIAIFTFLRNIVYIQDKTTSLAIS